MSRYDILLNDPKKDLPPKEQSPAAAPPPTTTIKTVTRPPDEATMRPDNERIIRPDDRATGGGRGELIRRGFEWRADQLRALKKLSLEEQLAGRSGSMSQMVRDALDAYLQKRAAEK